MKHFYIVIIVLLLVNCSKPKTVLICGDHICINKLEAEQYFEENLSLEVKIINNNKKKKFDLVEINLNKNPDETRKINIVSKKNTNQNLKKLSNKEIVKIKNNIKRKKKKKNSISKVTKIGKTIDKKDLSKINEKIVTNSNNNVSTFFNNKKREKDVIDVCTVLKKCNIEEITKYLLKQGNKKDYPNISKR